MHVSFLLLFSFFSSFLSLGVSLLCFLQIKKKKESVGVCVCYVVSFFVAFGMDFYHAQRERSSLSTWEKKKKT